MSRRPSWRGSMFQPANFAFGLILGVAVLIWVTTRYPGHVKTQIDTVLFIIGIGDLLFLRRRR